MEYTEIQKLIDSMGESKLTDLDIEFADGTKQTINCTGRYWYSSSYYGGDLKDWYNSF